MCAAETFLAGNSSGPALGILIYREEALLVGSKAHNFDRVLLVKPVHPTVFLETTAIN